MSTGSALSSGLSGAKLCRASLPERPRRAMKEYDAIVIGSGSGLILVDEALAHGMRVALVDRGPLGGTCLNLGCIPSKMLIFVADRIMEVQDSYKLGITSQIQSIDFSEVMARMRLSIGDTAGDIRDSLASTEDLDLYHQEGWFTDEKTLEVGGEKIWAPVIFIASGSRPYIPDIPGLNSTSYLTNETLLRLTERPESLVIIGGGYIGVEYAHFFSAMGTNVTLIESGDRLVMSEEPEISELLLTKLRGRFPVYTNTTVTTVKQESGRVRVMATSGGGADLEFTAERLLLATGRRSNADLLRVANTGIEVDDREYIKVNPHMETNVKNVFAVGDANGLYMYTHVANQEALLAGHNFFHGGHESMSYVAAPHAIYSHPQIASVGLTEAQAKRQFEIGIGRAGYRDVAKGQAMMETDGFAKAVVEYDSGRILGFHIIGPYAPIIIQEVVNAMESGGHTDEILAGMHIHPELPELIQRTLNTIQVPAGRRSRG